MITQQQEHGFLACLWAVASLLSFPKIDRSHSMVEKFSAMFLLRTSRGER
jgi:hypothetical protein